MAVDLDEAIAQQAQARKASFEAGKNRQRLAIEALSQLAEGEVVYFSSLWPESLEQAFKRISDLVEISARQTRIVLLAKISGNRIRVRRLTDGGARGKLAEWKNLKVGQSDALHEVWDEKEAYKELARAKATAIYLNRAKKGRFRVFLDEEDGWVVRVTHVPHPFPKEF